MKGFETRLARLERQVATAAGESIADAIVRVLREPGALAQPDEHVFAYWRRRIFDPRRPT